jgi:hypothetical protein
VSKRKPTVSKEGVELLFSRPRASEDTSFRHGRVNENPKTDLAEQTNVRIPTSSPVQGGKEKDAFYLLSTTIDEIEHLRRVLRRDYSLSRRATSKSAIIDAAIGALSRNPEMLAAWLRSFR